MSRSPLTWSSGEGKERTVVIGGELDNVISLCSGFGSGAYSESCWPASGSGSGLQPIDCQRRVEALPPNAWAPRRWPPSSRRPQFAREPAHGVGLHGIYRHRELFSSLAGGAFERADFEAAYAGGDAGQRHPVLACRTHRPVVEAVHDTHPQKASPAEHLSVI